MELGCLYDAGAEDVDHAEGDDDAHQGDESRHPLAAPGPGPALHTPHHPERLVLGPGIRGHRGHRGVQALVGRHSHLLHVVQVNSSQGLSQLVLNVVTATVAPVLQDG